PLGYSWLTLARQSLTNQANQIVDLVRIDTEARLQEGLEIDDALLQRHVDAQTDLNIAITVTHDGTTYTAGDPPEGKSERVTTNGASGQSVAVYIPESDVRA